MKSHNIIKSSFFHLLQRDHSITGTNCHTNSITIEHSKGIFQSNTKLSDKSFRRELFIVLILREMVVVKPPSVIRDMPDAVFFTDTDVFGSRQFLLIQSICNDLTDGMVDFPVFQYLFYVEVKFFYHSNHPLCYNMDHKLRYCVMLLRRHLPYI